MVKQVIRILLLIWFFSLAPPLYMFSFIKKRWLQEASAGLWDWIWPHTPDVGEKSAV